MSSPITVGITVDPLTALLAAAAIDAAHNIANGIAEAGELHAIHVARTDTRKHALAAAEAEGLAHLEAAAQTAEARFADLRRIAERLGIGAQLRAAIPARPAQADQSGLAAYIGSLETLALQVRNILLTEAGQRQHASDQGEALTDYAEPPLQAPTRPSARLLARLAHLDSIPDDIAALAGDYDGCMPGERAELLATELRLRIGEHLKAEQQRSLDAATATIIEQSLKDLGYQVEPVTDTFYVEGGLVHFRRPGWGDHMVRMRLDFRQKTANFNVIRAVREGDNQRSIADHLAEDRWCTEFPTLMQALAARGVNLNVTRRVEPGDLPVQLVNRDRLPTFADEDDAGRTKAPLARKLT